ncbi:MGH1-like glycoside hydrolase domain-containing protein [Catenulispora pinistramenti]|uniref:MGH1-like glycoside hydrolase domain-containing protein n=1 Tax=Catenulispora pinistramenti TaxID=2705254 RepID=UPI001E47258B|nr:glucosidase [Catenulispora pinistramenti]
MQAEQARLDAADDGRVLWRAWGPYLAERAWGTVREDYSAGGTAWDYFPHDHARSRAYRWNEDGLAGICDDRQWFCFALAFWNGRDPILKERLFGLTGPEGNHGEDVKEYWWYLDSTPTHSWMRWRYHYPQDAFPYYDLVEVNRSRGGDDAEYELVDTGVFDEGRYWSVTADYAKAGPHDICIRVTVENRGPREATLHVLPTLWFRNTWAWGLADHGDYPVVRGEGAQLVGDHKFVGRIVLSGDGTPTPLACDNESNGQLLWGVPGRSRYPKDGINDHVVHGAPTVNPDCSGSKGALHYVLTVPAGESAQIRLRLTADGPDAADISEHSSASPESTEDTEDTEDSKDAKDIKDADVSERPERSGSERPERSGSERSGSDRSGPERSEPAATEQAPTHAPPDLGPGFETVMAAREAEADEFFAELTPASCTADEALVLRQAVGGLLWSKQYYHYNAARWLKGDPLYPVEDRRDQGRNARWWHLSARDVIAMPDAWEYPWFAAWDLAFHAVALARVDPAFAKQQLELLLEGWYLHSSGQMPAYEWNFDDDNPPVHAWAALQVFHLDGARDFDFLKRVFRKLLMNFTWWVNHADPDGDNVFKGGFLGLDNIGPFDRHYGLPPGTFLQQSDGTAWMAMYSLNMMEMALILARKDSTYHDLVPKFYEHFALIAEAAYRIGLWSEQDGFFYDVLQVPGTGLVPVRVRSVVGLLPLTAATSVPTSHLRSITALSNRVRWYQSNRPEYTEHLGDDADGGQRRLLAMVGPDRLGRLLTHMLDEDEFLSGHGLRALSREHHDHPFSLAVAGKRYTLEYEPGESRTVMFGGNSNWRGPVWFPVNYMLIDALDRYHEFFGDSWRTPFPAPDGPPATLRQIANDIAHRLVSLFLKDADGRRPVFGDVKLFQHDPAWHDLIPFHEYFHGDTGAGLGASHQTGWTALVVNLILRRESGQPPRY